MRRSAIAVVVFAVACSSTTSDGTPCSAASTTVRFSKDSQLFVNIADTDATRKQGLMGVTKLPADHGMAFVWDSPTTTTFWMKDTLIPLSIAFVDENDRVITVTEMAPCEADPCPTYAATGPFTTAIEANAGWFEDHAVGPGDRMRLDRGACV